ncbi:uncharacterized protein LOC123540736 [Mercenaria mercenaria]|uniref:uncharacterized protein LOC123540736 n=1 Tax=Mercenaria mercenaria TaxID=6596 RepID=UPI00234EAA21|nr:uncharacterized protein LOC123540736 [Mercenaria mercenaria]
MKLDKDSIRILMKGLLVNSFSILEFEEPELRLPKYPLSFKGLSESLKIKRSDNGVPVTEFLKISKVPAPDGDSGHGRKRKRGEEQQSVVSELEVSTDILNDEDIDVMIDNLNRFMKKSNMDQLEQVVKQSKNVKELTAGLGIHLVAKLAENASVRYGHKGDYKCPCGCDSKLQQDPDMWIGSEELWYGELDLISGNKATGDSLVAFSVSNEVETEENNDDEGVLTFEHINSSKEGNSTQEMRYRGENETFKDNTVDWSQIKSSRTATIMRHVVAQSIVFAFTERNRHKNKGRLFPSVLLTPAFFQVFIYNPVDDLLFRSNQFYFSFDENDCRPFFILWVILNHRIFLVEKLSNSLKVSCSGFKRVMESVPEKISIFKMLDSYEPEISVKKCSDSGHTVYPHEMIDHECYIEAMKRCASESDCQR